MRGEGSDSVHRSGDLAAAKEPGMRDERMASEWSPSADTGGRSGGVKDWRETLYSGIV